MSTDGEVKLVHDTSWHHTHTCYTCGELFICSYMYCKEQVKRNCVRCMKTRVLSNTEKEKD